MPANEQTSRNLNSLHVVFGVSSIVLLLVTVWMLIADHNDEWRKYQTKGYDLDAWTGVQRMNEQNSAEFQRELERLRGQMVVAQVDSWFPNDGLKQDFLAAVKQAEAVAKFSRTDVVASLEETINAASQPRAEVLAAVQAEINSNPELKKLAAEAKADPAKQVEYDAKARELYEAALIKIAHAPEPTELTKKLEEYNANRVKFIDQVRELLKQIRFSEEKLISAVKLQRAYLDEARARYDASVSHGGSDDKIKELKSAYNNVYLALEGVDPEGKAAPGVTGVLPQMQQVKAARELLDDRLKQLLAKETDAQKKLNDQQDKLAQLQTVLQERSNSVIKDIIDLPIINAFGGRLKPEQIWLPSLTQQNGGFGQVARFDRCITCHVGISKTAPGSAVDPAYPQSHTLHISLTAPALELKQVEELNARLAANPGLAGANEELAKQFGFTIAETGLFQPDDATISVVLPGTLAAQAGLGMGDVIQKVGSATTTTQTEAASFLLDKMDWGKPFKLTIRRGVPQPYCSHPRMDLFVGTLSPHPAEKFGCTICHQGNGSATQFKWTSHTPNTKLQEKIWAGTQGWFNNHHWIFPMLPERFEESSCLKCHHNVVELDISRRFPDPPAPKLLAGFNLIKEYGCFGCHEIHGFDGPLKRIGPDLRNEPNYFAAAQQLLADPKFVALGNAAVLAAKELTLHPENDTVRHQLYAIVAAEAQTAAAAREGKSTAQTQLSADSLKMEGVLKDSEAPGQLRKVGPSLRFVDKKVGYDFLYDWIRNPTDFRPSTKMPRFFGLWDHLSGDELKKAETYETAEIQGITEYLISASQNYDPITLPGGTAAASLERGKQVFETRGCLACHSHRDFPKINAVQGPNLSNLGAKLSLQADKGQKWLYSWVREPNRYHTRTVMPNLFIEPYQNAQKELIDPAADVTAYLMASQKWTADSPDWKPTGIPPRNYFAADAATFNDPAKFKRFRDKNYDTKELGTALEALAYEHLLGRFMKKEAAEILQNGAPPSAAEQIRGDEVLFVGMNASNRLERLLNYVGKRSISKYGCFGCHDIPGYEDAKPIGAALADWGRKDTSKLAFENISTYVHNVMQGHGGHGPGNANGHGKTNGASAADAAETHDAIPAVVSGESHAPTAAPTDPFVVATTKALLPKSQQETTYDFFLDKLLANEREGFIWQKLNRPRSYDFEKTGMKPYNDKLRMPKFQFYQANGEQQQAIEAIMTFVLGLVAEPPAPQYVYQPKPPQTDILAGKTILEKYNCGGCHILEMERWEVEYVTDTFAAAPDFDGFPFEKVVLTPEQIAASKAIDKRGKMRATLTGLAQRDPKSGQIQKYSLDDDSPIKPDDTTTPGYYYFSLYQPTPLNGEYRPVAKNPIKVPETAIAKRSLSDERLKVWSSVGGDLAEYLYPVNVANEKEYKLDGKEQEAWGWGPPSLHGEGAKVQSQWLHSFLLDPYPLRPASVLRMPKFNMSSAEAQQLVNYFAAIDGVPYPYVDNPLTRLSYLEEAAKTHPERFEEALKIVGAQCSKCHLINDYSPGGSVKALAPQLGRIHQRLRPEFLRKWVANPNSVLPYTGMLRVVEHGKPVADGKFPGADPHAQSEAQLQALVDLLQNFDQYSKQKFSVQPYIKVPPPEGAAPATGAAPPATAPPAGTASPTPPPNGGN